MLSLVVPVRNWPTQRLDACVRSFLRLKSAALDEIVVVDFGSDKPVETSVADRRVRVVRVRANRWSLSEAINVGVAASRNRIIAKTDADIIVARESGPGIDEAVTDLADGVNGLAVVQAIDLPKTIDAKSALAKNSATLAGEGRLRARWGQGGLCLFAASVWNDIGGFDARYHGWGNEDNDFFDRIRRSGRGVRWLKPDEVRIFHVWHPPSYVAKDIVKARADNSEIYRSDKSIYRPILFHSTRFDRVRSINIVHRPRPLVTVAIASKARKGRRRMLAEAIRGFSGQIGNDFEVLIANNGSTEDEMARLRRSIERLPRGLAVRVIDIEEPSIPKARNRLTDEAHGRYICVADDDDIPLPNRIADHLACFEADAATHGSHGGWIDFDELTGVIEFNSGGERKLESLMFGRGKVTAHPTAFYRRDVMQAIRYDESYAVGSDLDLALRMANLNCRIEHTGSYVTLRRFHEENVTITDLSGQLSVGQEARQRISETLGDGYVWRLKEMAKKIPPTVCRNGIGKDHVISLIPPYAGKWRVVVSLADLGRHSRELVTSPQEYSHVDGADIATAPATIALNTATDLLETDSAAAISRSMPPNHAADRRIIVDRAGRLAELVEGDVGVVDCGIDPGLYFISQSIKGAGKALALRREIEHQFEIAAEIITDVEYRRRHTTPFDWDRLGSEDQAGRLVSPPTKDLDQVIAALSQLPENTMLRAMTSMVADFNCKDHLFRLITVPIRCAEGPTAVKRMLEKHTGQPFVTLNEAALRTPGGRLS